MIFDDLKNLTFYQRDPPHLDQAIDFLYEHRKDSFELGRYDIDGDNGLSRRSRKYPQQSRK